MEGRHDRSGEKNDVACLTLSPSAHTAFKGSTSSCQVLLSIHAPSARLGPLMSRPDWTDSRHVVLIKATALAGLLIRERALARIAHVHHSL